MPAAAFQAYVVRNMLAAGRSYFLTLWAWESIRGDLGKGVPGPKIFSKPFLLPDSGITEKT